MKKTVAMILAAVVMILSVSAFAVGQQGQKLTVDEAKKIALDYAKVTEEQAPRFTKMHLDWDDGRLVYEIEFYVGTTEYDMDVNAYTGMVTDFSCEPHFGFGDYDDDWNDWFDWD